MVENWHLLDLGSLLGYIEWGVDPRLVKVGMFEVRYYGLLWALGLVLGFLLMLRFARKEAFPEDLVYDLALYGTVGGVLGARLGHCLFYDFAYYSQDPWAVFRIWEGGLASHGGAIGVIIAVLLLAKKYKVHALWVFDRLVVPLALLAALIRLGNFFNSEIYGVETSLPWGTIFLRNQEVLPKHPTQLYEMLAYLIVFASLYWLYTRRERIRNTRGMLLSFFLLGVFIARFLLEFIKEDQSSFEANMLLNMGQWLSVPFILWGVWLLRCAVRSGAQPKPVFRVKRDARAGR